MTIKAEYYFMDTNNRLIYTMILGVAQILIRNVYSHV